MSGHGLTPVPSPATFGLFFGAAVCGQLAVMRDVWLGGEAPRDAGGVRCGDVGYPLAGSTHFPGAFPPAHFHLVIG